MEPFESLPPKVASLSSVYSVRDGAPNYSNKVPVSCSTTSLYGLVRPFLVLMRLGGMFYIQPEQPAPLSLSTNQIHPHSPEPVSVDSFPEKSRKWATFERYSIFYCFGLLLVGIAYCAKFLYSFWVGVHDRTFTQANLGRSGTE